MNYILQMQLKAGNKIHEDMYEALFDWPVGGAGIPCAHGDISRLLDLTTGGFSEGIGVTIAVRIDLFAGGTLPEPEHYCRLKPYGRGWISLKVENITTPTGAQTAQLQCVSVNQGA